MWMKVEHLSLVHWAVSFPGQSQPSTHLDHVLRYQWLLHAGVCCMELSAFVALSHSLTNKKLVSS